MSDRNWTTFNQKKAVSALPPSTCELKIGVSASVFTFDNWADVKNATHVVYLIDENIPAIGLKFIDGDTASDADLGVAYKINRNGHNRFSVTCTKLIKSLAFQIVPLERTRGGYKSGRWALDFEWDSENMIVDISAKK